MIIPRILVLGTFLPSDIKVRMAPSNRKVDPAIEGQLEKVWDALLMRAKQEGRLIYNGTSCRLNAYKQTKKGLELELATMEYKVRDGLIKIPEYFDLPEEYFRKGCYTAATVRTADDKYLMVRLSGKSMNMNGVDTLGGIMDADPEIKNGTDIFKALYKELSEEALISEKDINTRYLRALLMESQTNVGFYFEVTLHVTADDVISRQKDAVLDQEIASVESFTREQYINILQSQGENKRLLAAIFTRPAQN